MSSAAAAWAAPEPQSAMRQAGLGLGAVACSLLYTPAKLIYAGAGGLLGVSAYAVTGGRTDIMQSILDPSLRGDYVITPEHLTRERPLVFKGPSPEQLREQADDDPYAP